MTDFFHDNLPCGIEYAVLPIPQRRLVSFQIRVLAGAANDPPDRLGLARLTAEAIDKGTQQRSGRELADAFDAIGASHRTAAGRETTTSACTVLPEHFERAVALHAEFLRSPSFPQDVIEAGLQLAKQELLGLEDDAQALTDKLIAKRAFGDLLGRHPVGELETLDKITRHDIESHWRRRFHAGRTIVAVAGAIDAGHVADTFERCFTDFGTSARSGRESFPVDFSPGDVHLEKDLEQEQIAVCWPGVDATHVDFPIQQVILGILSGGMSGRLFTEVREKLGLVYWVNAWHDAPRSASMIFLGASTTPERCDQTYETLLRQVERLSEDVQTDELERAVTGLLAAFETRGDSTKARCGELAADLFFFGRPRSDEEKTASLKNVTIADIQRYLECYPRDPRCVVTVGRRPLVHSVDGRPTPKPPTVDVRPADLG